MILKVDMDHHDCKVYNVYIIDDPGMTLTFLRHGHICSKLLIVLISGPDIG